MSLDAGHPALARPMTPRPSLDAAIDDLLKGPDRER
jgi:hypothetical protein